MPISVSKGQNTSLSNAAPGMTTMAVGLGWNARATAGHAFDLDASAFMLNEAAVHGPWAQRVFVRAMHFGIDNA